MSHIYQIAKQQKALLLQNERHAANEMVNAYGNVWTRLKFQMDELTSQIEAARASGVEVSQAWLQRQKRYQALLQQTEAEISHFARFADVSIRNQQADAVHSAQENARLLALAGLGDTPEAARLISAWNRLPVESVQHLVGTLGDGSPLRSLLDQLGPAAAASAKKSLVTGVALGMNPRQIAGEMRQDAGLQLTQALTIARTEVLRSYRQASIESYQANDDVVEGWIWQASLSARTCGMCIAMNGTLHSLEEVFGSHPNCRCCPIPKAKSWAELGLPEVEDLPNEIVSGEDWFAQQDRETQAQILGPAKYAAYASGRISLSDLVSYHDNPKWGPGRNEASLQEAEEVAANKGRRRAA